MLSRTEPSISPGKDVISSTEHIEQQRLEVVRTISQVPGNPNYHLKGGLRTDGDGYDHESFKLTPRIAAAVFGCSCAFVGSQIQALFYFTLFSTIALDLHANSFVWFAAASSVGSITASVTAGPLADLLGRKFITLFAIFLSMIGMILCASTPSASGFITGQALGGFGAIIQELTAIAIVSELVPTKKRTVYGAVMISAFIPWAPGALYGQLLANYSWRWIGCVIAIWNLITLIILTVFYNPPSRINAMGLSKRELLHRIDFVGILLGLAGLITLLIAVTWGGSVYPWNSAQVIACLSVGLGLLVVFILWELFGSEYPLYPRRMIFAPRIFWCIMAVIFLASMTFVPMAIFWPIQSISVFDSGHTRTGLNTVPVGICILFGAIFANVLCGKFTKHVHWIMTGFCVLQTAGTGCMAAIDPNNIKTAWAPLVLGLFGIGGVTSPNQLVATFITPDDLLGTVTSLTFTVRFLGQLVSLSFMQNRLLHEVTKNANKYIVPAALQVGIYSPTEIKTLVSSLSAVPFHEYVQALPMVNTPEKYELLRYACAEAYAQSFKLLYYISIAFGGLSIIAAIIMGDVSKYMDSHVAFVL